MQPGVTGIPYDRQKPGPAVSALVTRKIFIGAQEGFLHDVFCILIVPDHPTRQIKGCIDMAEDNLFELRLLILFFQHRLSWLASSYYIKTPLNAILFPFWEKPLFWE